MALPEYTDGVFELYCIENDESEDYPEEKLRDTGMRFWYRELLVHRRVQLQQKRPRKMLLGKSERKSWKQSKLSRIRKRPLQARLLLTLMARSNGFKIRLQSPRENLNRPL